MAYYMRSNNASSHGNYMMSNSSMQGGYLMHSAKGSTWSKGHKYIDKRLIGGVWKYLYELPKEYLKNGREGAKKVAESADKDISAGYKATKQNVSNAAKNVGENIQKRHNYAVNEMKKTAEKAVDTVKDTAQKATQAAKDLKDYSTKVDEKVGKASNAAFMSGFKSVELKEKSDKAFEKHTKAMNDYLQTESKLASLRAEHESLTKDIAAKKDVDFDKVDKVEQDIKYYENKLQEQEKECTKLGLEAIAANQAWANNEKEGINAEAARDEALKETESLKYHTSAALNAIINSADNITSEGAKWLKEQIRSGNEFVTQSIANLKNGSEKTINAGLDFLTNAFGGSHFNINGSYVDNSRALPASSGRKYSGTGNKAQRTTTVSGRPVSNNDYRRRPKR